MGLYAIYRAILSIRTRQEGEMLTNIHQVLLLLLLLLLLLHLNCSWQIEYIMVVYLHQI